MYGVGTGLIKALGYFMCNRQEDGCGGVVGTGRKACWLGERGSKLSSDCRRRSKTLTAGQMRKIGR